MEEVSSLVIEETLDQGGPMGIHYQKRAEGLWPSFQSDGVTLFFARCASIFTFKAPATLHDRLIDAYSFAVIPAKQQVQVIGKTAISDGVYLSASAALVEQVNKLYDIRLSEKLATIGSVAILPRTNWLNEVMHRYVYERAVAKRRDNSATTFIEQELVKETYYRLENYSVLDKSRFDLDSRAIDLRSPMLRSAMTFIEANLFRDITITDIANHINASESTLLREFQKRLDRSPSVYIVDRRLEESMILIKSQRYSIGQVSDLVGYENVSAFSAAFKKRFNISPSHVAVSDPIKLVQL